MHNKHLLLIFFIILIVFSGCKSKKPVVERTTRPPVAEVPKKIPEEPKVEVEVIKGITEEVIAKEEVPPVQIIRTSPPVRREFRAAWVATVANINWPSKSGLSTAEQQKEAIALLDFLEKHNYNAVVFQARPQADALYKSSLEPWSFFITGEQGKAPEPFYDPLHFWIEAAHDRGMELHVWLNPYRAHHSTGGPITESSIVKTRPETVVKLANGMYWMDPSKKETQDHTAAVVMDIVKRYDIDGIHFDDYFYPYASYNKGKDFPDAAVYAAYQNSGGKLSKADWRREGVNNFVERIYKEIKKEKPEVKFGISPFGIWRPGHPASIKGMDQYNELYADAKLWLNEGWVDYYSPQLYWKINPTAQSFPVLLGWWEEENKKRRHLWPGINLDFGGGQENVDETLNQIMITRGMFPDGAGTVHWSMAPLLKYPELSAAILAGPYQKEALVPASLWLDPVFPEAPEANAIIVQNKVNLTWDHPNIDEVFRWVVYFKYKGVWNYEILNRTQTSFELENYQDEHAKKSPITDLGITAVDRSGNESEFEEVQLKR